MLKPNNGVQRTALDVCHRRSGRSHRAGAFLVRCEIVVSAAQQVDPFRLCRAMPRHGDEAADIILEEFACEVDFRKSTLRMPIHGSIDGDPQISITTRRDARAAMIPDNLLERKGGRRNCQAHAVACALHISTIEDGKNAPYRTPRSAPDFTVITGDFSGMVRMKAVTALAEKRESGPQPALSQWDLA